MNSSGKTMSSAPSPAASSMSRRAFSRHLSLRNITGVACTTATRQVFFRSRMGRPPCRMISRLYQTNTLKRNRFRRKMQQLSYSGVNSASMCRRCVPPAARTAPEARIVSVCASYAQFSLLAMKKDGRKGSANPSRSMESRRLTPPRLDRNRNAHPSAGIGGAFW